MHKKTSVIIICWQRVPQVSSNECNRYAMLVFCLPKSPAKILNEVGPQNVSTEQTVTMTVLLQIEIAFFLEGNYLLKKFSLHDIEIQVFGISGGRDTNIALCNVA
ncbi:MAG: hypothetical protein KKC76_10565 [Proteobacteria bacterium]|nr:hypothetical protein [Pseudomonadota bacterium]MBU4296248.1 hypothetical protein [Pseudomonadota bacterium]MCG2746394.1 hypothetical protein [Desulfobulbaceae bacterium]